MKFGFEVDGAAGVREYLERIKGALIDEDVLAGAAQAVKDSILKRTSSGIDAAGRSFKPYTAGYKKRRRMAGRPTDTVDLVFSGKMLKDVTCVVEGAQASVTFSTEESLAKAYRVQGSGGGRNKVKREFFAPGPEEKDLAVSFFSRHIERLLGSVGKGDLT